MSPAGLVRSLFGGVWGGGRGRRGTQALPNDINYEICQGFYSSWQDKTRNFGQVGSLSVCEGGGEGERKEGGREQRALPDGIKYEIRRNSMCL